MAHKTKLFTHLAQRWQDLFNARFEVLLYDLTSTYFESNPPFPEGGKRRHGYSRDKRPDCVQVVIALIVTPEGFPLAYKVLAGNTSDKTTLHVTLHRRLRDLAPGLTPRSALEKFATIQMLDAHLPTTDGRTVVLSRYMHPETDVDMLLHRLKLE